MTLLSARGHITRKTEQIRLSWLMLLGRHDLVICSYLVPSPDTIAASPVTQLWAVIFLCFFWKKISNERTWRCSCDFLKRVILVFCTCLLRALSGQVSWSWQVSSFGTMRGLIYAWMCLSMNLIASVSSPFLWKWSILCHFLMVRRLSVTGDKYLKPYVTAEPETTFARRDPTDEFLIIASDGLWDVMTNELACEIVSRCLQEGSPLHNIDLNSGPRPEEETIQEPYPSRSALAAALLTRLALGRKSSDNISVIVVDLKRSWEEEKGLKAQNLKRREKVKEKTKGWPFCIVSWSSMRKKEQNLLVMDRRIRKLPFITDGRTFWIRTRLFLEFLLLGKSGRGSVFCTWQCGVVDANVPSH